MARPDQPSDPPKQVLHLATGPVHYSDVGSGAPIVALHGSPGSGRDFRWLAPVLEPHFRVIRPDLSGHGATPPHGRSHWTIPGRAEFTVRFLAALELRDVTLVGHSIGGPVAMEAALASPDRVARVAVISSIGMRKHQVLRGKPVRAVSTALNLPILGPLLVPGLRAGIRAAGFPRSTPDHEAVDSVHAVARVDFKERAATVRALAAAATSTLAVWSEDDPIIERSIFEELAAALPPGPRLVFADGHHNPQKTHAVEIGAALREFAQG